MLQWEGKEMKVQYRRVSSVLQNLDRQETLDYCEKVFSEKESASTKDRPALQAMLEFVYGGYASPKDFLDYIDKTGEFKIWVNRQRLWKNNWSTMIAKSDALGEISSDKD